MTENTPRLVIIRTIEDISNYYDTIGTHLSMTKMLDIEYPFLNKVERNLLKIANCPIVDSLETGKKNYVKNLYFQCSKLTMAKKYQINTNDRSFFASIIVFKDMLLNHPFKCTKNTYK